MAKLTKEQVSTKERAMIVSFLISFIGSIIFAILLTFNFILIAIPAGIWTIVFGIVWIKAAQQLNRNDEWHNEND